MLFSSFDIVCGVSVIGLSLIHDAKVQKLFELNQKEKRIRFNLSLQVGIGFPFNSLHTEYFLQ